MKEKTDWLNTFFEKNAWGVLVALLGMASIFTLLRSQVSANTNDIETFEDAMIEIVQLQKNIIELQTNQANLTDDIDEIKGDVKTLLQR